MIQPGTGSNASFRHSAEWEAHEATWLAWPHNEETWPGKVSEVEEIYLQMIEALTSGETVRLLVTGEPMREKVSKRVRARGLSEKKIVYDLIPNVDAWIRDYGPSFVLADSGGKKEITGVKWVFNAWGNKYESLAEDNLAGEWIANQLEIPFLYPDMVFEGGSIDTNGEGTCLVTEQCLLNPNRNPHLSKPQIEEKLRDFLGVSHFIWLGEGIEGDDTDGHIDDIARFVNPTTVVAAVEENPDDKNRAPLRENWRRLREARDSMGQRLTLVPIPMPDRVEAGGVRLPASYLNFYLANEVVLVPIFGQAKDSTALQILQGLFPGRRIVGIRSETLVMGLGAIHCVTHEQPRSL